MAVQWQKYQLEVVRGRYDNGRIAVMLMRGMGSRYGALSANIPNVPLEADEFIVPAWDLPDELLKLVLATEEFQDTGKRAFGGSAPGATAGPEAPIWRVRVADVQ